MKKIIFFTPIIFLIFATTLTKNSTKKLDKEIFQLKENITAGDFGNISRDKGLLLVGAAENTIRLLPPLNTSKKEIDQAFEILSEVVKEIKKN